MKMTAKADSERSQRGANQYAVYLETPDGRLRSPAQTRPCGNIAYLRKHLDEMKRSTAASKLTNWTETASGAMTVAALLGCVGILVHSFSISICTSRQTPRRFTFSAQSPLPPLSRNRSDAAWFAGAV
jgi:hypothetical protein